jgi:hypothetical protein
VTSLADNYTRKAEVLDCSYPVWDAAGNKAQRIALRYICGHTETYLSLDLGHGWKPRSRRQIAADELRITCPAGWKLCRACSEAAR